MRTPEEIRKAINHMLDAQVGCNKAGDTVKEGLCSRIADVLRWTLCQPSEFQEQIRKMDELDRLGNAHKKARTN